MDDEREIMELLESLERFDLHGLLRELWDAPILFINEPVSYFIDMPPKPYKPRRTRNRNKKSLNPDVT